MTVSSEAAATSLAPPESVGINGATALVIVFAVVGGLLFVVGMILLKRSEYQAPEFEKTTLQGLVISATSYADEHGVPKTGLEFVRDTVEPVHVFCGREPKLPLRLWVFLSSKLVAIAVAIMFATIKIGEAGLSWSCSYVNEDGSSSSTSSTTSSAGSSAGSIDFGDVRSNIVNTVVTSAFSAGASKLVSAYQLPKTVSQVPEIVLAVTSVGILIAACIFQATDASAGLVDTAQRTSLALSLTFTATIYSWVGKDVVVAFIKFIVANYLHTRNEWKPDRDMPASAHEMTPKGESVLNPVANIDVVEGTG